MTEFVDLGTACCKVGIRPSNGYTRLRRRGVDPSTLRRWKGKAWLTREQMAVFAGPIAQQPPCDGAIDTRTAFKKLGLRLTMGQRRLKDAGINPQSLPYRNKKYWLTQEQFDQFERALPAIAEQKIKQKIASLQAQLTGR